jgi:ubiquinone/menaquinone biosynthesis C-methylase UbiE
MGRGKVFPAADATSLLNPLRRLVQSPARLVAAMQLSADDRVLEIGCGPGYFSPTLAAAVPDGQLVAFDLQREMLVLAGERLERSPSASASTVQGDAMRLSFRARCFDAVLIATVLGEVPDVDECLRDVRRVLRAGGCLSVSETRRDSDFIPLPQLRARVEPHGFELVARTGMRWQYVARFRPSPLPR